MMLFFGWSVVEAFKQGSAQVKRMHQIPCHNCGFFTNDFRLKCTVHPSKVCTEEAIGCIDYELEAYDSKNYRKRQGKFD